MAIVTAMKMAQEKKNKEREAFQGIGRLANWKINSLEVDMTFESITLFIE